MVRHRSAFRETALKAGEPSRTLRDVQSAVMAYRTQHAKLLEYGRTTKDDLRSRLVERQNCDAYEWALLISTPKGERYPARSRRDHYGLTVRDLDRQLSERRRMLEGLEIDSGFQHGSRDALGTRRGGSVNCHGRCHGKGLPW